MKKIIGGISAIAFVLAIVIAWPRIGPVSSDFEARSGETLRYTISYPATWEALDASDSDADLKGPDPIAEFVRFRISDEGRGSPEDFLKNAREHGYVNNVRSVSLANGIRAQSWEEEVAMAVDLPGTWVWYALPSPDGHTYSAGTHLRGTPRQARRQRFLMEKILGSIKFKDVKETPKPVKK